VEEKISFVILTGLSGAGKSKTVGIMEDLGYFCIDNLPPYLIFDFLKISEKTEGKINKICAVIDVRSKEFLDVLPSIIEKLKKDKSLSVKLVFLEASTESLVRRFSETRRRHPVEAGISLEEKINEEKKTLLEIKEMADVVIDTTNFEMRDLKKQIISILSYPEAEGTKVFLVTFGYKYGVPLQADIVIDVRFIPNPFYKEDLSGLNGLSDEIKNYVLSFDETKVFLSKFEDFLLFLIPYYIREGKSYLTIALGCTGGKHRSVAIGEFLYDFLNKNGFTVSVEHRDVTK
jgi:UPF0042 nucleotide-binding protein